MPVGDTTHGWVATLSDGTVAVEHKDQWEIIEGARKPIVRLAQFMAKNGLHITSFRYNANGQTYHMPKLDTRFEKGGLQPDYYGFEYIFEREEGFEGVKESLMVDIGAFYGNVSMHTIIEIGDQKTVWTQVRVNYRSAQMLKAKGE